MRKPIFRTAAVLLLLCAHLSSAVFAEEEDLELALEPPEGGEAELTEQLQDEDAKAQEIARGGGDVEEVDEEILGGEDNRPPETEVPQIDDESYRATAGTEQMRILRFHKERTTNRPILEETEQEEAPHRFHGAAGVHFGLAEPSISQGTADFQVAVSEHFALGALANISTQSVLAAFAANYYSRRPFDGIWVQLGFGYEKFSSGQTNFLNDTSVSATTPILFDMGWRWLEEKHNLTFAFGAGSNIYLFTSDPKFYFNVKFLAGFAWNIFPH